MCIHCAIMDLQELAKNRPVCLEFQNMINQKALSNKTDEILDLRKKLEIATRTVADTESVRLHDQRLRRQTPDERHKGLLPRNE